MARSSDPWDGDQRKPMPADDALAQEVEKEFREEARSHARNLCRCADTVLCIAHATERATRLVRRERERKFSEISPLAADEMAHLQKRAEAAECERDALRRERAAVQAERDASEDALHAAVEREMRKAFSKMQDDGYTKPTFGDFERIATNVAESLVRRERGQAEKAWWEERKRAEAAERERDELIAGRPWKRRLLAAYHSMKKERDEARAAFEEQTRTGLEIARQRDEATREKATTIADCEKAVAAARWERDAMREGKVAAERKCDEARKDYDEMRAAWDEATRRLAEYREKYERAKRHAHRWWGTGDICQCCGDPYPLDMRAPEAKP